MSAELRSGAIAELLHLRRGDIERDGHGLGFGEGQRRCVELQPVEHIAKAAVRNIERLVVARQRVLGRGDHDFIGTDEAHGEPRGGLPWRGFLRNREGVERLAWVVGEVDVGVYCLMGEGADGRGGGLPSGGWGGEDEGRDQEGAHGGRVGETAELGRVRIRHDQTRKFSGSNIQFLEVLDHFPKGILVFLDPLFVLRGIKRWLPEADNAHLGR